jgi:hypothetical protein
MLSIEKTIFDPVPPQDTVWWRCATVHEKSQGEQRDDKTTDTQTRLLLAHSPRQSTCPDVSLDRRLNELVAPACMNVNIE